jgi:hypothetical protein
MQIRKITYPHSLSKYSHRLTNEILEDIHRYVHVKTLIKLYILYYDYTFYSTVHRSKRLLLLFFKRTLARKKCVK